MKQATADWEDKIQKQTYTLDTYRAYYKKAVPQIQQFTAEVKAQNAELQEAARLEKEFERRGFREAFRWGITGFALTMAGQTIRRIGESFLSPMSKFVDSIDQMDPVFREWEKVSKTMENSFVKIGRVMIREILPIMRKVAEYMEDTAAFIEKHPALAKGIIGIGALLAVGGRLMIGLGQIMSTIAAYKSLTFLAASTAGQAAAAAGGGSAAALGMEAIGARTTLKFLGGVSIWNAIKKGLVSLASNLDAASKAFAAMGVSGAFSTAITFATTKLKSFGVLLLSVGKSLVAGFGKVLGSIVTIVKTVFLTSLAGAISGGVLLGASAVQGLSQTSWGRQAGFQPIKRYAVAGAYWLGGGGQTDKWGQTVGGDQEARGIRWATAVARALGLVEDGAEDAADALREVALTFEDVATEATALYSDYMKREEEAREQLAQDIVDLEAEFQEDRKEAAEDFEQDRLELEEEYAKERVEITEEYERDKARLIEDYNRQVLKAQQDFNREIARTQEDFARDQAQRQADFQRSLADLSDDLQRDLAKLQQDYYRDVQDAREDHLRKLRSLELDHQYRVEDLVAKRDALGLVIEQRRYNREKAELADDLEQRLQDLRDAYVRERRERIEEYNRRLQEMQEEFAREQALREEEHQLKLQEMREEFAIEQQRRKEDHELEMKELADQHKEKLEQLAEQHQTELAELQQHYKDQLDLLAREKMKEIAKLREAYQRERDERARMLRYEMQELLNIEQQGYDQMIQAAREYVNQLLAEADRLDSADGKASGGYTSGIVRTGEEGIEYILSHETTLAAERAVGGRLTQSNILAAMVASRRETVGRQSLQVSLYQNVDFHGYLTKAEQSVLKKMMYNMSQAGLLDAIGAL